MVWMINNCCIPNTRLNYITCNDHIRNKGKGIPLFYCLLHAFNFKLFKNNTFT